MSRRGRATATEVQEELGEPISNSAVRGMLRLLGDKGLVKHEQDGPRYVYFPAIRSETASRSALRHLTRNERFLQQSQPVSRHGEPEPELVLDKALEGFIKSAQ